MPQDERQLEKLKREYQWFKDHVDRLRSDYPRGGHIVVKDQEPLGVWPTRSEALSHGIEKYGNVPFLVRSIQEEGPFQVQFTIRTSF